MLFRKVVVIVHEHITIVQTNCMSKMQNRVQGLKAQKNGERFENILMFFANRCGFRFIKIPTGCKTVGQKIFRVKSPFDFILVSDSRTIFFDAKSTLEETFSYSSIDQDQVRNLSEVKNNINLSGYIINFNGLVFFFDVETLKAVKPRSGLRKTQGCYLGTDKEINFEVLK